jgi:RHS repeat-associated protein
LGNGLAETWTFGTAQKQPTQLAVSGVNATWTWGYGADSTNNGNVMSAGIAANGVNITQSFGYDKINRLTGSSETGGPGWTRNYGYDNWANGWVTANSGLTLASTTPFCTSTCSNFDTNNRLNIMSSAYDVAGNQTGIASSLSAYDAENRQISYALGGVTTTYTYDGDGRRVKKVSGSTTTVYVYDAQGQLAAEYAPVQAAACVTCYLTADTLGSTRMITDETGTQRECHDYLPFGEEIPRTGAGGCYTSNTSNTLKFTGKERDQETGLDYFQARYYSGAQGRFTSPDEFKGGIVDPLTGQDIETNTALPYADIGDPQTLNKYMYVRNNPLRYVDPDGHDFGDWLQTGAEFVEGVARGGAASVSMGAVGAPSSSDTLASRIGQAVGAGVVGFVGTNAAEAGVVGGVLTSPSGVGAVAGGAVAVAGVAAAVGAVKELRLST